MRALVPCERSQRLSKHHKHKHLQSRGTPKHPNHNETKSQHICNDPPKSRTRSGQVNTHPNTAARPIPHLIDKQQLTEIPAPASTPPPTVIQSAIADPAAGRYLGDGPAAVAVVHDGGGVRLLVLQLVPPLGGLEVGLETARRAARRRRGRHASRSRSGSNARPGQDRTAETGETERARSPPHAPSGRRVEFWRRELPDWGEDGREDPSREIRRRMRREGGERERK
jgi:hypothetical protein